MKTKVIAVANQKGGVGKTTTTINLAAALAELGHRSLIIDIDPQGNASTGLGSDPESRDLTTYDLLFEDVGLDAASIPTDVENLDIIVSNTDLSSVDLDLVTQENRSFLLKEILRSDASTLAGYEYIFLDCPPSLNILTINAIVAADSILVPLQSEFFALEGLSQLMVTIREIRETANPELRIEGVVLTMFDKRNNLSLQVEKDAREHLGHLVFDTRIPRNVRLSEAPSHGLSVHEYDRYSIGAQAYRRLAHEIINKNKELG
ncbi:ParA family protein [Poseidonocella sedimentorum]|uniref:Chromosome partitioning protein ParA n=1 Tax=Poseidonocella sedimentorum TaxID=871652 RepID=A0A1I6D6G4_9RHOB|nr:AAA family ATPase [Poseidonocella sedimentorum]SFR01048.1 chromosome partitioning protein [Poseidonocella sedimentorum]